MYMYRHRLLSIKSEVFSENRLALSLKNIFGRYQHTMGSRRRKMVLSIKLWFNVDYHFPCMSYEGFEP